jgi:hypothetical protein
MVTPFASGMLRAIDVYYNWRTSSVGHYSWHWSFS